MLTWDIAMSRTIVSPGKAYIDDIKGPETLEIFDFFLRIVFVTHLPRKQIHEVTHTAIVDVNSPLTIFWRITRATSNQGRFSDRIRDSRSLIDPECGTDFTENKSSKFLISKDLHCTISVFFLVSSRRKVITAMASMLVITANQTGAEIIFFRQCWIRIFRKWSKSWEKWLLPTNMPE